MIFWNFGQAKGKIYLLGSTPAALPASGARHGAAGRSAASRDTRTPNTARQHSDTSRTKSRRETRREIRRLQREADRPPTAETRTEEEQDSLFDTKIDSIFGAPPLSPIAPADSTAPTGNDSLLRDSLRQDTTRRDTTRKNLSWTTSSAAKTRTRSTTTYATARSISTTRAISTTRT